MGIMELVLCSMILVVLVSSFIAGSKAVMRKIAEKQHTTESVLSEETEQYENVERETEAEPGEQVLEQFPAQEYIETVGSAEPTTPVAGGVAGTIATATVCSALVATLVFTLLYKWQQKKTIEKIQAMPTTSTENVAQNKEDIKICGNDTVEKNLRMIASYLHGQMSNDDKAKFERVMNTAKMFDKLFPAGGANHGRIGSCYLPALVEVSEKIANAPSLPIATSLMPYFHRTCDVLREAMEGELDAYQKTAAMDLAARTKAVEQMAAVHHDTDDVLPMQLQLES